MLAGWRYFNPLLTINPRKILFFRYLSVVESDFPMDF